MAAQPGSGITHDPRWLVAGAGGFLAAVAELWVIRGLPLGMVMGILAGVPILTAGFMAGPLAAIGAGGLTAVLLWFTAGSLPALNFLIMDGVPSTALAVLAMRPRGFAFGGPMVFSGLYPLVLLGLGAAAYADYPGGIMGMLSDAIGMMSAEFPSLTLSATTRASLAWVMPVMAAMALAVITAINGLIAQRLLERLGLALLPSAGWQAMRLPFWYALLPAAAGGVWLLDRSEPLALSALLILLVPFFFQGLAGVHRRAAALGGGRMVLAGFYVLMVIFLQLMAPAVVALGLYDQWARRAPRGGNPT